jgi:hypothetical protein
MTAPDIPLDERFYGTWVHPLEESEPVIFRDDGSVSWFGEEGTFGTYEYETDCGNGYPFKCFKGDGTGLEVSLPSATFRLKPDFDWHLNSWDIDLNRDGYEKQALLFRDGSFERPIMPGHFDKLGAGWSISNTSSHNPGYKDADNYFDASYNTNTVTSSDPLLANSIYAYDESTDTWEVTQGADEQSNYHYSTGKEFILRTNEDSLAASFDHGLTWKSLPHLTKGDSWLTEEVLTGNRVLRQFNVTPPHRCDERSCADPERESYEIWTLDAAADSPSWVHQSSFTLPYRRYQGPDLYAHPTTETVAWDAVTEDGHNISEISYNHGTTWQSFNHDCYDPDVTIPHTKGFFCLNEQGKVRWFNSITKTWTTHNVNSDDFVTPGDPTDGAYIRRGNQLIKWQPNGTETVITTLSGSLGYGDIYVFDDQVIVNKIGIWRTWR